MSYNQLEELPLRAAVEASSTREASEGFWANCWTRVKSTTQTCASYVAVKAEAAANRAADVARTVRHSPTTHPHLFKWYTVGFEFLTAPWNGWALAQAIDTFRDTSGKTKFLGATIPSLIVCGILTTLTGLSAALIHRYTNEHYGEKPHHEQVNPSDVSYLTRVYIGLLAVGDFLDHTIGDVSTWILWLELVRPDASLLFKRIVYSLIIAGSSLNTVKEWSVCFKNILRHYFGAQYGEEDDLKPGPLVSYTMVWSFLTAMINGYSIGLLLDALISLSPFAVGLSIPGIIIWSLFGILPAIGSTATHFFQYMSYDKHGGFSHSDDELTASGKGLISTAQWLDFIAHFEDYFATPAQLMSIGMVNAKVPPHLQALALTGFGITTAVACISETGVCFEEAKEGVSKLFAKFGLFQKQPPAPEHTRGPVDLENEFLVLSYGT